MKRKLGLLCILCLMACSVEAQFIYGTTGLLHMPTADMQKDKTFMFGASRLNSHAMPGNWYYDTYNYYLNITFFPWLEIGYTCVLFTAEHMGTEEYGAEGFTNQDRSFHGRLRLWKAGWWKEWTPQIVLGANDFITGGNGGVHDFTEIAVAGDANGYFNRYYIAATKHLSWNGEWGMHAAYVYNKRGKAKLNGVAVGIDYQFAMKGEELWQKAVNGLSLMAEYDSKFVNVGAKYALWKDRFHIITELRECKYPSVGAYFKIHLK